MEARRTGRASRTVESTPDSGSGASNPSLEASHAQVRPLLHGPASSVPSGTDEVPYHGNAMMIHVLTLSLPISLSVAHAGAFRYPVGDGSLHSYYDSNPFGEDGHDGIDLNGNGGGDTDCGDPVYAAGDGVVTESTYNGTATTGYGGYLRICHVTTAGERCTAYGHLQNRMGLQIGDTVSAGQQIGEIGNEGRSDTCHLHFTVTTQDQMTSGYYSSESAIPDWVLEPHAFIAGTNYIDTCETQTVWSDAKPITLVVTDPDDDHFDFHSYYWDDLDDAGGLDDIDGKYTLLDRGDMGSAYANPVINDEGHTNNHEKWLTGDPNGDGWTDIILIAHNNGDMKAQVWLSNGDGTFQSRALWLESERQYDHYFHGDNGKLIAGYLTSGGDMRWYKCTANPAGTAYDACEFWGELGGSHDDTYIVGDFDGDNRADIMRGYVKSDAQSCPTDSSQKKLKWRMLPGNSSSPETWATNWGCEGSDYLPADINGDGDDDLVQVRFEGSDVSRLIVARSDRSRLIGDGTWRADMGSYRFDYFIFDVNGDGYDDIINYKDNSKDHIHALYSTRSAFDYYDLQKSYVDMERSGQFLFGRFGELHLDLGDEEVCE